VQKRNGLSPITTFGPQASLEHADGPANTVRAATDFAMTNEIGQTVRGIPPPYLKRGR
jgi:hypothetical protein